jgi:hypothetical protein
MGASGVIRVVKGDLSLRVGGVSGIEKLYDFNMGYHERHPYI